MRSRTVPALLGTLLLVSACTSSRAGTQSASSPREGGTLRIGSVGKIDSMNPFVTIEQMPLDLFPNIYPLLIQYDTRLDFVPSFATSWTQSPDGLSWTFHTRADALWSDGRPLTAADAAWTLNTIVHFKNGPTANYGGTVAHMTSASAPDATTLIVHYAQPVANVLSQLEQIPILPEHVWASLAAGNGKALKTYTNVPGGGKPVVSGGPFVLTKYATDQIALFTRNPHWWGTRPHIDGFGIEYFSDDDAMVTALEHQQIDAIGEPGLAPTDVAPLKAAKLHVYTGPSMGFTDLIINTNPHKTTHRELLNPLVREAMEYATDREQIIKTAFLGYAQPGSTIIPPATGAWHDPAARPLPFDIAKANQLLDEAGYAKGPNGIRVADGHPMSYTVDFATDESGPGDRAFQILQNDFRQIGIAITQRNLDSNAAFNALSAPDDKYLTFDLGMWDWNTLIDPDFMLMVMTCSQFGDWSDSGYCNPTYDRLYLQQGTTTDLAARRRIVYEMQDMVQRERPYIVLVYKDWLEAWSPSWAGFVESPEGFLNQLWNTSLLRVHRV